MRLLETATLISFLLSSLITTCNNAALSEQEQKKYKDFLEGQGLYSIQDDVDILTIANFKDEVMNSPQGVLVEFYNSWCGFCQRFAPSWKALGSDIKGWSDLIRIAAYDCSNEDNFPLCRDYEIMAYPTLRYFHEGFKEEPKNFGLTVEKGDDVNSHRRKVIETIIQEQAHGRGMMYPNLIPYQYNDTSKIYQSATPETKFVFLIIDKPDSFDAPAVALDLHKTPNILIKYAFNNNSVLLNKLSLDDNKKYPLIIIFDHNNNREILQNTVDSRDSLRKAIVSYLTSKQVKVTDENPVNKEIFTGKWLEANVPEMSELIQERARKALKERIKKMGDVVFQVDLENVLRYSLKHEVSIVKTLTGEKLDALKAYLSVLRKYFPFGLNGQQFLALLTETVKNKNEVDGKEIGALVSNAEKPESRVFSTPPGWLGCKGSTKHFRGYPCGLWKLFHYLTVNAAEQNSEPLEVLNAMHGYIKNFFGCADCSQHFQEMAKKRDMQSVSSSDSAIVWLWMAHNQVNKRLSGDPTEDPEFPKIQYPLPERCPQCRFANNTYNIPEVLRYTKHVYSNINVRYIGADTSILHLGLEGIGANSNSTSGIFQTLDMSMCFVLYVASFLLLALIIRMFLKRGYRKKPYVHDLLGKV